MGAILLFLLCAALVALLLRDSVSGKDEPPRWL